MFEDLMHSIWEEFSKLVFHVEIEVAARAPKRSRRATATARPEELDYSGGTARRPALGAAAGGRGGRGPAGAAAAELGRGRRSAAASPSRSRPWSRTSTTRSAATTPAGAAAARSTRSATAPERPRIRRAHHDPVREFIRAFNEGDLDAFVAVLDPEVELHSMRGLRKGLEAARLWATRPPGGVQQTIELDTLHEGGSEEAGQGAGADHAAAGTGTRTARRPAPTRWPGSSSCATTGSSAGGPSTDRDEAIAMSQPDEAALVDRRVLRRTIVRQWRSAPRTRRRPRPGAGRCSTLRPRTATWSSTGSAPTARRRWRPTRRAPATACSTSAAASATRRSGSPSWSAPRGRRVGVDVAAAVHRGCARRRPKRRARRTSTSRSPTCRSATSAGPSTTPSRAWA